MVSFAVKTKIKETMDNNKNAIKRDKAELAQSLESGSILSKVVILGTAHGINMPGKCSPDKNNYDFTTYFSLFLFGLVVFCLIYVAALSDN